MPGRSPRDVALLAAVLLAVGLLLAVTLRTGEDGSGGGTPAGGSVDAADARSACSELMRRRHPATAAAGLSEWSAGFDGRVWTARGIATSHSGPRGQQRTAFSCVMQYNPLTGAWTLLALTGLN